MTSMTAAWTWGFAGLYSSGTWRRGGHGRRLLFFTPIFTVFTAMFLFNMQIQRWDDEQEAFGTRSLAHYHRRRRGRSSLHEWDGLTH